MSFYVERLKECIESRITIKQVTRYLFGKYNPHLSEVEITDLLFSGYTHHNFEVVCVELIASSRPAYDQNGNLCNLMGEISSYGEPVVTTNYEAYAWDNADRIRSVVNHLTYPSQFAILAYSDTSRDSLTKRVAKKLNLLAKLHQVRDVLTAIVDTRSDAGYEPVYNASVNDEVFIQAYGRLRKGVVVDTTGSRFIVGYLVPSNIVDIRYKTLHLSEIFEGAKT